MWVQAALRDGFSSKMLNFIELYLLCASCNENFLVYGLQRASLLSTGNRNLISRTTVGMETQYLLCTLHCYLLRGIETKENTLFLFIRFRC